MDYLAQQNRKDRGQEFSPQETITAEGKNVVIIGGGDTGADCLGTTIRQRAARIMQFEIMPRPPDGRKNENPWPQWPSVFRISSAHEEGGTRDYNVSTKSFTGEDGRVTSLNCVRVEWQPTAGGTAPVSRSAGQ